MNLTQASKVSLHFTGKATEALGEGTHLRPSAAFAAPAIGGAGHTCSPHTSSVWTSPWQDLISCSTFKFTQRCWINVPFRLKCLFFFFLQCLRKCIIGVQVYHTHLLSGGIEVHLKNNK